eukprot:3679388-Alexandrium_andersonii.AAC.1
MEGPVIPAADSVVGWIRATRPHALPSAPPTGPRRAAPAEVRLRLAAWVGRRLRQVAQRHPRG